jgi:hypothetical protein
LFWAEAGNSRQQQKLHVFVLTVLTSARSLVLAKA